MLTRLAIRGAIVFTAALAAIGCSANKFGSPLQTANHASPAADVPWPLPLVGATETTVSDADHAALKSLLAMGLLSERQGQAAQAERIYNVVIQREPRNPVPYHRLGVMCAQEGRFADADRYFALALQRDPSNHQLLSDIGYSYYLQHRLPEAEDVLRHALEWKPNDSAICNNLAVVVGEQGRDEECMALFSRVNGEAQASANMAFVYTQRGEMEKAKASYSRALTLDRGLRPAAEAMIQLAQREQLQRQPVGGPIRIPSTVVGAVRLPAQPTAVHQAAFFDRPPPPEMPAAVGRAHTAVYEQRALPRGSNAAVPRARIRDVW